MTDQHPRTTGPRKLAGLFYFGFPLAVSSQTAQPLIADAAIPDRELTEAEKTLQTRRRKAARRQAASQGNL